ncbi:large ribosomal subunit protein mL63-like [Styela clava]
MRLTLYVLKFGKIPGRLRYGKHQLPHHISEKSRAEFVKFLQIELENEMWLTRPYLSKAQEEYLPNGTRFTAQEHRWKNTTSIELEDELREFKNLRYRINIPSHVALEDRWSSLHIEAKWERNKDITVNRFQKYSEMAQIKRIPDRLPRPVDKWSEWERVKGVKQNKSLECYNSDSSET